MKIKFFCSSFYLNVQLLIKNIDVFTYSKK